MRMPALAAATLFAIVLALPAAVGVRANAAEAGAITTVVGTPDRSTTVSPSLVTDPGAIVSGAVLEVRCETYVDDDADGLDDGVENCALNRHAPVAYLPHGLDWTRPANVDWYLARAALRFHHNNCSDDQVVPIGGLTQLRLVTRLHRRKRGLVSLHPCSHYGDNIGSGRGPYEEDHRFFLQPGDASHAGAANAADWIVYGHVYPNDIGGTNVQYWFFYAYNDNVGSFNHEGDWESITVRLDSRGTATGVYACAHADCELRNDIKWHDGTHPVIWVADGSHASYTTEFACDRAGIVEGLADNCQTVSAYRWFTWRGGLGTHAGYQGGGVINVGEIGHVLNGQRFINYHGVWGEIGSAPPPFSGVTTGPRTPTQQPSWNVGGL